MSYEIVKSIAIKDDKVFITSACSNISPRHFERWEAPKLSDAYQAGGLEALLPRLAIEVWHGNFHLQNGSKLCRMLSESIECIAQHPLLHHFLDRDRAAAYMTAHVLHRMGNGPAPDISDLEALRSDRDAVLDVCSKNPSAFDYAVDAIRKDREAARAHIQANAHQIMFFMPVFFRGDKELAMLALEQDGTIYRALDPALQSDKDVVRLAFDASRNRRYFEHLPDLIPESLRNDKDFMSQIISECPKMHFHRAPELLQNKDLVESLLRTGAWSPYTLRDIPSCHLNDPQIQSIISESVKDNPEVLNKALEILSERGILLRKPSLDNILHAANEKYTARSSGAPALEKNPVR